MHARRKKNQFLAKNVCVDVKVSYNVSQKSPKVVYHKKYNFQNKIQWKIQ